jgi:hypothetical protein
MAEDTGDISIDWSTAEVSSPRQGQLSLELRVALQPQPDNFWMHAFRKISQRQEREVRGGEMWDVTGPQGSYSPWITVSGIEPGSEDAVKSGLQRLVDAATAQAPKDRRAAEQEGRRRVEAEEAANEAARRMTERFRET